MKFDGSLRESKIAAEGCCVDISRHCIGFQLVFDMREHAFGDGGPIDKWFTQQMYENAYSY